MFPELNEALQLLAAPWPLDLSRADLDLPALLLLAAALGWAAGLRLYLLIFALGMAARAGLVLLPSGLAVLAHPLVLAAAGFLLFIEFFADKIPGIDSLWDALHTFIRIPAGAALAAALAGGEGAAAQVAIGLLGGTLAAGTHFAKAGSRALINTSPEPFSNVLASLAEESMLLAGGWLLLSHPWLFLLALALFMVLALAVIVLLWRLLGALFSRRRAPIAPSASSTSFHARRDV